MLCLDPFALYVFLRPALFRLLFDVTVDLLVLKRLVWDAPSCHRRERDLRYKQGKG